MLKSLECPHCGGPVPASIDDLQAAAAVLICPTCAKRVYLTMGKVSNFQPDGAQAGYDSGD